MFLANGLSVPFSGLFSVPFLMLLNWHPARCERGAVRDAAAAAGDDGGHGVAADGGQRHARPVALAEAAQRRLLNGVVAQVTPQGGAKRPKKCHQIDTSTNINTIYQ